MRRYEVVRMREGIWMRWTVVSVSLRDDQTWDVIQEFVTRTEAILYVHEVTARGHSIEDAGLP